MDRVERVIWQAVGALGILLIAAQALIPIILDKIGVVPL